MLTGQDYFALSTATPLQRAICRAASGLSLGDLTHHPDVIETLGDLGLLAGTQPKELYIAAGIRTGKSLFAAALIAWVSQTADFSHLGPGEIPRISIVSVNKDLAHVTLNHFIGRSQESPKLRGLVSVKDKDSAYIIQESTGRKIEVAVVSNQREGATLVARWQALIIFDEASRFASGGDNVINLEGARDAGLLRLVPGGMIVGIGSPMAPYGFFYEMVTKHLFNPSKTVLSIKAPAPLLNPLWWTPERIEDARRQDPVVYVRDILAEFTSDEDGLFPPKAVQQCTRSTPVVCKPEPGLHYVAAIDPATRSNGFCLVIATRKGNKRIVVLAKEWRGLPDRPLDSREIVQQVGEIVAQYNIRNVMTDQWLADVLMERAREHGYVIYQHRPTVEERAKSYRAVLDRFLSGEIEIPPDVQLRADLVRTKKVTLPSGGFQIKLPKTADGRHADFIPPLMMALSHFCQEEDIPEPEMTPKLEGDILKKKVLTKIKNERRNIRRVENGLFGNSGNKAFLQGFRIKK